MKTLENIILNLKLRKSLNNTVKYIDGTYDLNQLLKEINVDIDDCSLLYITVMTNLYMKKSYDIKTQSINEAIQNSQKLFDISNDKEIELPTVYIIEDCNLLDLDVFNNLLSCLSNYSKLILVGDKNMISPIDNNVSDLILNGIGNRYLEKIELEKPQREFKCMDNVLKVKDVNALKNLSKINNCTYTGTLNWLEVKEALISNNSYNEFYNYLNSSKFNRSYMPYLNRYIKRPELYFTKTIIFSTESNLDNVLSNGVIVSNFLNIYYHILIEDVKNKFIELGCPSFRDILKLKISKIDKTVMILIEEEFREKYDSNKIFFFNSFFNIDNLDIDIILEQTKDFIFDYALSNPDASLFIDNEDIIRLATFKCYKLLNIEKINQKIFNDVEYTNSIGKNQDIDNLLSQYSDYDDILNIIYNIPYSIFNLVDFKPTINKKSNHQNKGYLISDFNISIFDIEKIINFKINIVNLIAERYSLKGIELVSRGKDESNISDSIFKAICENNVDSSSIHIANLNKYCSKELKNIEYKFKSSEDLIKLDEYLKIKEKFVYNTLDKSVTLLKNGFLDLLNDIKIDWKKLNENI